MKVRITSDGTYNGSRVENAETGEPIERVTRADICIDYKKMTATLYMDLPVVDITCEAVIVTAKTLIYDPDDRDSIERALGVLSARMEELDR